jgi:hypothetical protein
MYPTIIYIEILKFLYDDDENDLTLYDSLLLIALIARNISNIGVDSAHSLMFITR